jgi:predicted Na+-dependent transporter
LLLFVNTLAVEKRKWNPGGGKWLQCLATQALIFIFVPVCTAAAASLMVKDPDFVFGVAVASLAPCALVNPFFAALRGGDAGMALLNVLVSTLICSFVTAPLLKWTNLSPVFLDMRFLSLYLTLLTAVPTAISFGVIRLYPAVSSRVRPWLPLSNSIILAVLMFILVGSSVDRVPLRLLLSYDFAALVFLFIVLDFGVFLLAKFSALQFIKRPMAESLALSVASRNFAVSSSLMLAFHPKAALPSAIGLVVHSLFFQWLLNGRKVGR